MGCGCSSQLNVLESAPGVAVRHLRSVDDLTLTDIETAWILANTAASTNKSKSPPVVKRTGWKTIRIFVSSTFKDFDSEREILVKKVFPDLRAWCQSRRLHLIECDLRWGVPIDATTETSLRTCLGEIDRCYAENIMPFFINMTSERVGWIPLGDEVPDAVKSEYKWIDGLSVTEMEILHGAYRIDNPNALFLVRSPSFLETVPENLRSHFVDENENIAPYKLQILKQMISQKFKSSSRLEYYTCEFEGLNKDSNKPHLRLENKFADAVMNFFQERISAQYPLIEAKHLDPFEETKLHHEAFMKMISERVVGRDGLLEDLLNTYISPETPPPLLIAGGPGLGKTSIMSALADRCITMSLSNRLPKPSKSKHWTIFYHFVGAVPGSTDLLAMLRRLLLELKIVKKPSKLPAAIEDAVGLVRSALSKSSTKNAIVIIDAVNQFDDVHGAPAPVSWLPTQLSQNVRLVVSATPESKQYTLIHDLAADWKLEQIRPLDRVTKQHLVKSHLLRWSKQLDQGQMELLLNKKSSDNPLWLSLACEELRVFGQFREVTNKIRKMPDGLLELEEAILARFESEGDGHLLVATLCLLESSARGLLESELLEILAAITSLPQDLVTLLEEKNAAAEGKNSASAKTKAQSGVNKAKKDKITAAKEKQRPKSTKSSNIVAPAELGNSNETKDGAISANNIDVSKDAFVPEQSNGSDRLTAKQWADLYRVLGPFVRPFGSSGEGRLDFYHRSLSKAVRRRYFSVAKQSPLGETVLKQDKIIAWFHRILADYFKSKCPDLDRRIEEYPKHAYLSKTAGDLVDFLSDWSVFDACYDPDFSRQLSQAWAFVYDMLLSGAARKHARRIPSTGAGATGEFNTIGSEVYAKMEEVYVKAVDAIPNPIDPNTEEGKSHIERIEKVARVLMQNGRYDAAIRLADRLIALSAPVSDQLNTPTPTPAEMAADSGAGDAEQNEKAEQEQGEVELPSSTQEPLLPPGVSKETMLWHASFIYLKAQIYDEEMRSQDYMYASHLPKLTTLVECFEKAITIFDQLAPNDERLGKCLNRVGFHYSGIAMRNGTEKLKKEDAKEMAVKRVEDAIDFYTHMGDQPVNLADCYITRGVCEGQATKNQIDFYMQGLNLAIEHVGLFHPILDRAYLNVGIYYEDNRLTQDAYAYFRKWYQLLVAVYGPSHPRTLRAVRILNEGVYQRLAASNGHSVPALGLQIVNEDEDDDSAPENQAPAPALPIDE